MKKNDMQVWSFLQESKYTGFYLANDDDEKMFIEWDKNYIEKHTSLKEIWKPLLIMKSSPGIDSDIADIHRPWNMIVTERAKNLLVPLLKDTVEFLPFINPDDTYYLVHIIKTVDCLDYDKSNWVYYYEEDAEGNDTKEIRALQVWPGGAVFKKELIKDVYLFKLPKCESTYYTNLFKDFCDQHQLLGMSFELKRLCGLS